MSEKEDGDGKHTDMKDVPEDAVERLLSEPFMEGKEGPYERKKKIFPS